MKNGAAMNVLNYLLLSPWQLGNVGKIVAARSFRWRFTSLLSKEKTEHCSSTWQCGGGWDEHC